MLAGARGGIAHVSGLNPNATDDHREGLLTAQNRGFASSSPTFAGSTSMTSVVPG